MNRIKVKSETLLSVGYEPDSEVLELEFTGGAVYEYHHVQPYLYMGLMHSNSKTDYFDKHIRDRYEFQKIKENKA
jgi:hypothetical protein